MPLTQQLVDAAFGIDLANGELGRQVSQNGLLPFVFGRPTGDQPLSIEEGTQFGWVV